MSMPMLAMKTDMQAPAAVMGAGTLDILRRIATLQLELTMLVEPQRSTHTYRSRFSEDREDSYRSLFPEDPEDRYNQQMAQYNARRQDLATQIDALIKML
tara:strand:+ start:992 stop:1291 length:300 start_codon:yes stop_codon:yes gene_type:complete